jgi:hypothetical protein
MMSTVNILAALAPADRLAALRDALADRGAWMTWAPAVAAVAGGLALIYLSRHWYDRRGVLRRFAENAERLGLSQPEQAALVQLARLAELRRIDAVYGLQTAFDRGAAAYLDGPHTRAMTDAQRTEAVATVESLREKLGFAQESYARQRESIGSAFHRAGSPVRIVRRGRPGSMQATIARASHDGVTVASDLPLEARPGEAWRLRHVDRAGQQWEFDAAVIAGAGRETVVRLIGEPRCVNLRRAPRVPTHMPAYLAAFPFVRGSEATVPQFVPGTLTEIGGPGLRVDSSLRAEVGDRVLAVIKGHEERMIQGVAKVRRLLPGEGSNVLVLEMVGLADDEVGALVQETNRAARRADLAVRAPAADAMAHTEGAAWDDEDVGAAAGREVSHV